MDDDSYVHVDALLNLLSKLPSRHLYLGNIDEGPGGPHRDPASPWYVTQEEWPSERYPMWAHGAGYVLSKVRLCLSAAALLHRLLSRQVQAGDMMLLPRSVFDIGNLDQRVESIC